MELPTVLERYVTPAGDLVQVNTAGERANVAVFDVEVIRDGDVVEYFEDVTRWYIQSLEQRRGWRPA